ncbi:Piwi domain-containing protein [Chaetomium fimeti]|uniref:Piwi domain-containing protein n=1 Tax=Chaetomium fimeti TaxID=1854472 RepID=A0AAE0H739_9PEZI|nr:Piwi domain-containing protein [Chaetomium fimeti]
MTKTASDIQGGIHPVCLLESTVASKCTARVDAQFFDNILLKANLKQGGVNHKMWFPTSQIFSSWGAMALGLDVTNSPPGLGRGNVSPSIISMRPSRSRSGKNKKDVTEPHSFRTLLQPHLDRYAKGLNNKDPSVLIIYRDGVAEGQYNHVVRSEYQGIRDVCTAKYGSRNQALPKIAVIVLGKRHHTRFYPSRSDASQADRNGNTLPGTVVDRSITSPFL